MNNFKSTDITIESIIAAVAQGQDIRRQMDRSLAELCQHGCNVCGRKYIATQSPWGDTLQVCQHIWNAIERLPIGMVQHHIGGMLIDGLRIELFDDGPARF